MQVSARSLGELLLVSTVMVLGTVLYYQRDIYVLAAPMVIFFAVSLFMVLDERDCHGPKSSSSSAPLLPLMSGECFASSALPHRDAASLEGASQEDRHYFAHKNRTLDLTTMGYVWVGWLLYGLLFSPVFTSFAEQQEHKWLIWAQAGVSVLFMWLSYLGPVRRHPPTVFVILCVQSLMLLVPHNDNIVQIMPLWMVLLKMGFYMFIYVLTNMVQLLSPPRVLEEEQQMWSHIRFLRRAQYLYRVQLRVIQSAWLLLLNHWVTFGVGGLQLIALVVYCSYLLLRQKVESEQHHQQQQPMSYAAVMASPTPAYAHNPTTILMMNGTPTHYMEPSSTTVLQPNSPAVMSAAAAAPPYQQPTLVAGPPQPMSPTYANMIHQARAAAVTAPTPTTAAAPSTATPPTTTTDPKKQSSSSASQRAGSSSSKKSKKSKHISSLREPVPLAIAQFQQRNRHDRISDDDDDDDNDSSGSESDSYRRHRRERRRSRSRSRSSSSSSHRSSRHRRHHRDSEADESYDDEATVVVETGEVEENDAAAAHERYSLGKVV